MTLRTRRLLHRVLASSQVCCRLSFSARHGFVGAASARRGSVTRASYLFHGRASRTHVLHALLMDLEKALMFKRHAHHGQTPSSKSCSVQILFFPCFLATPLALDCLLFNGSLHIPLPLESHAGEQIDFGYLELQTMTARVAIDRSSGILFFPRNCICTATSLFFNCLIHLFVQSMGQGYGRPSFGAFFF